MSILAQPLTADAFAPFGDVLELTDRDSLTINAGMCERHHDLAKLDFGPGRAGISLFDGAARSLPYKLDLVERHPLGSQAFIPMNGIPLLVTVCPDQNGTPGTPLAFLMAPNQGINLHRNTWHGVLAPLSPDGMQRGLYAVIDHIGTGPNLQEHSFASPWVIKASP